MKKKAIIFDWDGTLLDSAWYKRENFIRLFQELGALPHQIELLHKKYSGLSRMVLFSKVYEAYFSNPLPDTLFAQLSRKYSELNLKSGSNVKLFPEVPEILNHHQQKLLFISSSAPTEEISQIATALGIAKHFKEILGSRPGFEKGNEHFSYLMEKYSLTQVDMLFVGDDEQDERLANACNIDFIKARKPLII